MQFLIGPIFKIRKKLFRVKTPDKRDKEIGLGKNEFQTLGKLSFADRGWKNWVWRVEQIEQVDKWVLDKCSQRTHSTRDGRTTWNMGLPSEIWDFIFEIWGFVFEIWGFVFEIWGFIFEIWGFIFEICGFIFEIWGFQMKYGAFYLKYGVLYLKHGAFNLKIWGFYLTNMWLSFEIWGFTFAQSVGTSAYN